MLPFPSYRPASHSTRFTPHPTITPPLYPPFLNSSSPSSPFLIMKKSNFDKKFLFLKKTPPESGQAKNDVKNNSSNASNNDSNDFTKTKYVGKQGSFYFPENAFKKGLDVKEQNVKFAIFDVMGVSKKEEEFSAIKKTIPFNVISQEFRARRQTEKVINKFYDNNNSPCSNENMGSSKAGNRIRSSTAGIEQLKKGRARSPTIQKETGYSSSPVLFDPKLFGRTKKQQKTVKIFFDYYLKDYEEKSSTNRNSLSLMSMSVRKPSCFQIVPKRVETEGAEKRNSIASPIHKIQLNKKKEDYNFFKVLIHYWKNNEEEEPRNRPKQGGKKFVWNRKIDFKTLSKKLLQILHLLYEIKINISEFNSRIFPERPFQRDGSYKFLKAVKYGKYQIVKEMLESNKLYILEYDYIERTALHISVMKGHVRIAHLLIENGAYTNHIDKTDRIPLHYALEQGYYELANMLLYYKSSPWSSPGCEISKICTDEKMLKLIKRARQIDLCLKFTPARIRRLIWKTEKETLKDFFPWQ